MQPEDTRRDDQRHLFRLHVDHIVNPDHALVKPVQCILRDPPRRQLRRYQPCLSAPHTK